MSFFDLRFACGESSLSVARFSLHEEISTLFVVSVLARSPQADIDLEAIVGQPASLRITTGFRFGLEGTRLWAGICDRIEQVHAVQPTLAARERSTYSLRIVPAFWALTQRRNYRIFQHESIPDIVEEILAEWHIGASFELDRRRYPKLEYRVQYGESDHAFVCRLLEEAGIAFTLPAPTDEEQEPRLVLGDRLQRNPRRPGPALRYVDNPNEASEMEFVTAVRLSHEIRPGAHTIRDFDFRRPPFPLFGEAPRADAPEARYEQYFYSPGAFLVETEGQDGTPVADMKGTARNDAPFGLDRAARGLAGMRVGRRGVVFEGNAVDLRPGSVFTIGGHPHPEIGEETELLVTEVSLEGTAEGSWSMGGVAVFTEEPYLPPYRTSKPKVHGVQSATVVGPSGHEIYTDELGRVVVQFPWDREGTSADDSSCWVRVNQGWAGAGYGLFCIPRVGQEVLVSFVTGDPDQPLIVGRVHNAVQPVPHRLPDHETRSAWKSDSSVGSEGYSEIFLEDDAGSELLAERAEKNLRRLVKNDETLTVGRDREQRVEVSQTSTTLANRVEVTGGDRSESVGGARRAVLGGDHRRFVGGDEVERTGVDRLVYVGGDEDHVVVGKERTRVATDVHLEVKGQRSQRIEGTQSLTVRLDQREKVAGSHALVAGRDAHFKAADAIVGEAPDVTVKGPGGFLRIDGGGVTIGGTIVKINAGGSPGEGAGAHPEAPEEPDLERIPAIVDLRWSEARVPIGSAVRAIFTVRNFRGGERAEVRVYEQDEGGARDLVDTFEVPVPIADGDVEASWARRPEQVEADLQEDLSAGELAPLEYRFEVECRGVRATVPSGPLWLTNTLVVRALDEDTGAPAAAGTRVVLLTAEGKREARTQGGEATFTDVLVGPIEIEAVKGPGES